MVSKKREQEQGKCFGGLLIPETSSGNHVLGPLVHDSMKRIIRYYAGLTTALSCPVVLREVTVGRLDVLEGGFGALQGHG